MEVFNFLQKKQPGIEQVSSYKQQVKGVNWPIIPWVCSKSSLTYYNIVDIAHLFWLFCFFSVRLLSVLRGHSFFSSPPQRSMASNFEGFLCYPVHFCPIFILQKEPVFPFIIFSAKQGSYWYHFYNVFGMTRSLTGDWTRDVPHSKPALYH